MKINQLYFFFACLFLFASCQNDKQKTNTEVSSIKIEIPELLQRGDNLMKGEEWDLVQNQYAKALKDLRSDENTNEAYLKLAEVYMTEARITGEHGHYYPAAIDILNKVVKTELEPTDIRFRALSHLASVQLSQHDFSNALGTAKEAISINAYNAQIYGALTDAYVELGEYDNAVKTADKMISIKPDLRSYSRVSYLREIHGDVDGSLQAMGMAADAGYPGYEQTAWTRLTLGNLLKTYGRNEEAEAQYKYAMQQRPNYPFAIAELADLEIKKGNNKKAEELLQKACGIIPEFGFYVQLAELYKNTNRTEESNKLMDEIWVMLEDDVNSGHNMNLEYADLHLNMTGDYDKALEYARIEQAKRPKNIDVNRMLAKIYVKKGDFENARTYMEAASITGSKHPDLVKLRGVIAKAKSGKKQADKSLSLN